MDPEAFEDFKRRNEGIIQMREEIAEKYRDIYPQDAEYMCPEDWPIHPWVVNWARKHKPDQETYDRAYFEIVEREAGARYVMAPRLIKKFLKDKPSVEELVTNDWLGYLSSPPTFVVRADLATSTNQLLYGKYATALFAGADYWRAEFSFVAGPHMEDGMVTTMWTVGLYERWMKFFDDGDVLTFYQCPGMTFPPGILEIVKKYIPDIVIPIESWSRTPEGPIIVRYDGKSKEVSISDEDMAKVREIIPQFMNRRHLRSGLKMKEMPKKRPYFVVDWVRPVREICMDLRIEMFAKWAHATLYIPMAPGMQTFTLVNFWGMSQWWNDVWYALNATRILGHGQWLYAYEPIPPILNTLLALPWETFKRRLSELYFTGPKNILCDPVCPLVSPEERAPIVHEMRRIQFDEGRMYKDHASPQDDGIPPPSAMMIAFPVPFLKEANLKDIFANPNNLSKEYKELLESEGGVDFKTGRIPPYSEVPRLKWLLDPNFEWLKPKDFPPIDWSKGQVWPIDLTREKMKIMVEEGYDGSGKNILHYSALADGKMGQLGETILLGTLQYKLPTCGCSPMCG